jgi:hypothetical protein
LDFHSEDEFYKFLELTGLTNQLRYVIIPQANMKFGLYIEENLETPQYVILTYYLET